MKVVIRVDASLDIGTGHVMRCLTLAKALAKKNVEVTFICRNHVGNLIKRIQNEGFKVITLFTEVIETTWENYPAHLKWLGVTQEQDANDVLPIIKELAPDWVIVDHYALDRIWEEKVRPYCQNLMVIDDLGDRSHECDLLLDQNYGSTVEKYEGKLPSHCTVLAGTRYALLRLEFAQYRAQSLMRRKKTKLENILISMGGVDPENYTGQVLQELAKIRLKELKNINVVLGRTAPNVKKVKEIAMSMPVKTVVNVDVTFMAKIMAQSDLAIGAAGATAWERCCLGLPTIQMIVADNQRLIAHALARSNIALLMQEVEQLPELLSEIKLDLLSRNSSVICDGKGVLRVMSHLV